MNKVWIFVFTILTFFSAFGQENLPKEAQAIVAEGKLLYKSEMASWYGTDLFLGNHKNQEDIGGYFSYTKEGAAKCIFFSKSATPKVIGTITFDSTYNIQTAHVDLAERLFSKNENDLFEMRRIASDKIKSDTIFKNYTDMRLNLIPLIEGKERKVYVLTGPSKNGVVVFGNDYLLTFDKGNKLLAIKRLHKNIIPIEYGKAEQDGKEVVSAMHSHLSETGDFITATDICTLMLYEKFAKWKTHQVLSKKYLSIWNCETNELNVVPRSTPEKVNKDQNKGDVKQN